MELPIGAMLATRKTARGKLKVDHYAIAVQVLRAAADEQADAVEYYSTMIGPVCHYDGGPTLRLPVRPTLPADLQTTLPTTTMEAFMGISE
jgi:hypothetical protein